MGTMLLYIDPGTGTMLLAAILGIFTTVVFACRGLLLRLKFFFTGGRSKDYKEEGDDLVIFNEHKRYLSTFRPILAELQKRKIPVRYLTASKDDPLLEKNLEGIKCEFIGEGNLAWARLNHVRAKVLLSTTPGLSVYQWKRSKGVQYYVHILHAVGSALGYRMFGLDFYDAVLVGGPVHEKEIREIEEIRQIPKKTIVTVGCPYMDSLKQRFDAVPKRENPVRTVLLAPSWGQSGLLTRFGEPLIRALIDTGARLIIRPHPQTVLTEKEILEPLQEKFPESDQVAWDLSDDNFPALLMSDIMVTDFSGVIFDYALVFDKPILYAGDAFDPAPYDAAFVDHPLWKYSVLPKIGISFGEDDLGNMKDLIEKALTGKGYAEGRSDARSQVWKYEGQGAKAAADALVAFYTHKG